MYMVCSYNQKYVAMMYFDNLNKKLFSGITELLIFFSFEKGIQKQQKKKKTKCGILKFVFI